MGEKRYLQRGAVLAVAKVNATFHDQANHTGSATFGRQWRRSITTLTVAALLAGTAGVAVAAPKAGAKTEEKPNSTMARAEKALRDIGSKAKDTASDVTSYALSLIGVDYKFGGNTPDQGLDCSGLIRYVFQQATGISLPRTAREQARMGQSVAIDKLQPGDLVFFNTRRFQFSHVGLYVGDNRFVHAPSRGGAVEVVNLDQRYWQKTFNGARRVVSGLPAELTLGVTTAEAAIAPVPAAVIAPTPAIAPVTISTRLSPADH